MVIFVVHPGSPSGHPDKSSKASVVVVIPARYESTRLPGKPLAEIDGRPMIEHVYRRAAAAPSVDRVIVATDDARVRRAVEAFGGNARMTSPAHRSGTDRLAEVAEDLDCDLIVNVQGDEPLIDPGMIEEAIRPFGSDATLMMATVRRPIDRAEDLDDPNVVKVVTDCDGYALYFSRSPIPFNRDARPPAYKHIGLYVYRREFLLAFARLEPTPLEQVESLEQLRALEHGFRIKAVETLHDSIGVDTPEDLKRVRRIALEGSRA
ncbi:MAG: 3-deoxy-manno-octulosonate cytidylyltransferase [Acidobacteria bacterium]|nr:3-deoxy-manno-octulosonate cytidylyltransferase [Acidobacteriota bacterium]